jgi:hypothetical protein
MAIIMTFGLRQKTTSVWLLPMTVAPRFSLMPEKIGRPMEINPLRNIIA